MKKPLRLIGFILVLLFFAATSCKKEPPYMNDGIITGFDMRACVCCGGLMITFTGDKTPYAGDFKLIGNETDLGQEYKEKFPVYVKVAWKDDTTNICKHIIITRIARR
jgi:hypothetical protein